MRKFIPWLMVLLWALIATYGAAGQDLLQANPAVMHSESSLKVQMAAPAAETEGTWTSGGPVGGYVTCLAVSPSDPDVMVAASKGSVFRTADGGATWTWAGDLYMQYGDTPSTTNLATILDLEIAPDNPEVFYAGTQTGIYISQNQGRDWTNTMPGYVFVNSIAVDPVHPKNILIATGRASVQSDSETIGIFKSSDGGDTWQEKLPRETEDEEELDAVLSVLFDNNDPLVVYAGTQKRNDLGGDNGGLRKSSDGGETWSPLKVYAEYDVFALAMTPSGFSPATIYAYASKYGSGDLYASTDQGTTWDPLEKPDDASGFLVIDPADADIVVTSGPDSLYQYDDGTGQWAEIAADAFPLRPRGMTINPKNGNFFVGDYNGGFFQSSDGGDPWFFANLINTTINDLAVNPKDAKTVYAAIEGLGFPLAVTHNAGDSWDYRENSETYLNAVAVDPQVSTTIYAAKDTLTLQNYGSKAFIYKSINSGQDWEKNAYVECGLPPCEIKAQQILVSTTDSRRILVGATGDEGTLVRTTDGGTSWDGLGTDTTTAALAEDPNQADVVYGGGAALNLDFVFRYNEVWGNWSTTTLIGPDNIEIVRGLAVDQASRLYVAASDGLYRWQSGSGATHFTNLPADSVMAVAVDRSASPNVVYIGISGMGVYRSQDEGASWEALNDGLGSLFITNLQLSDGQPKILYAGTNNQGVWSLLVGNGDGNSNSIYLPLVVGN